MESKVQDLRIKSLFCGFSRFWKTIQFTSVQWQNSSMCLQKIFAKLTTVNWSFGLQPSSGLFSYCSRRSVTTHFDLKRL